MLIVLQNSGEEYRCMWLLIESFVHYFVKKHSGSRFSTRKEVLYYTRVDWFFSCEGQEGWGTL